MLPGEKEAGQGEDPQAEGGDQVDGGGVQAEAMLEPATAAAEGQFTNVTFLRGLVISSL